MTGGVAVEVPDGEEPVAACPYCGRPFPAERLRALHVGEAHRDRMTAGEAEAWDDARREESDELFILHLKVVAALVLITMGFAYLYAFVWS